MKVDDSMAVMRRAALVLLVLGLGTSMLSFPLGVGIGAAGEVSVALQEVKGAADGTGSSAGDERRWVTLESSENGMSTQFYQDPKSLIVSLRANAVIPHHIAGVLSIYLNSTRSREWVSFLNSVEEFPTGEPGRHLIYQFYDMPWPIGDREFLFERKLTKDRRTRTVSAQYRSVDHPVKPARKSVIRGETRHTCWRFRSLGRHTEINVESQINPQIPLSKWMMGVFQRMYSHNSFQSLARLVERASPHPEFVHW